MNYWRQTRWLLVVCLCVTGQWLVTRLHAADSTNAVPLAKLFSPAHHRPPPAGRGKSPVDFFRQLLAMTPDDRDDYLKSTSPEISERLRAKIHEYEALNPNERELRLRATELRWYLMPLLRDSPTNRPARLAEIPPDVRELVQARLVEWSILPPPLQQEFLENERILHYFAHVDTSNSPAGNPGREPSESERAHWNTLSEAERRQVSAGFNKFFELTSDEKQKTLNTLSEVERRQMAKTLQAFDQMPPLQRAECVNAFARFSSMTTLEKTEFLKNAERWSAMSPAERQAWRDLVVNVPQWPPLPSGFVLPQPEEPKPGVATNHN